MATVSPGLRAGGRMSRASALLPRVGSSPDAQVQPVVEEPAVQPFQTTIGLVVSTQVTDGAVFARRADAAAPVAMTLLRPHDAPPSFDERQIRSVR